jgi:WD40 repeat protein
MTSRFPTPDNVHQLTRLRQLGEPPIPPHHRGQRLSIGPEARFLVSVAQGPKGSLRWWRLSEDTALPQVTHPLDGGLAAAVTPDGNTVLSATVRGEIQQWSATAGSLLREASLEETFTSLHLSPLGDSLLLTGYNGGAWLWDVHDWRMRREMQDSRIQLKCCTLSPDGLLAVAGGERNSVHFWDATTGASLEPLSVHASDVWDVAFHPSGHLLAVGTSWEYIHLIDVESRRVVRTLKGAASGNWSLSFSPDGELLVSSYGTGFVVLRVRDGARLFGDHDLNDQQMSSAVFSPDGRFIAWGQGDGTVGLWGVPE